MTDLDPVPEQMSTDGAYLRELEVRTGVLDGRACTILLIDGVDVLDLQQPIHRPDGSRYPDGPMVYLPADPDSLLPPDSAGLLPAADPKHAMIGVCDCGEPGCGSLWLQLRRDGDTVRWGPDPHSSRASIDRTWWFALRQYLDAVDQGQRYTLAWETRPRLFARELRRRRDSLFGFLMINAVTNKPIQLLDAKVWPSQDDILIEVASDQGIRSSIATRCESHPGPLLNLQSETTSRNVSAAFRKRNLRRDTPGAAGCAPDGLSSRDSR